MAIIDRIKGLFTQKTLGNSLGWVSRNNFGGSGFNPPQQVVGITYKAIDKIGLSLSIYEPKVTKRNGDPYTNHPLYTLFDNPNPRTSSASDFIHLYAMLFEIYGETFWYLARGENTRRPKEVYLLDPSKVEIKTSGGELVGYVLHKSSGEQVPFMPDEIIHDKRPNPFNELRGMSVVERAAAYIDTEINTTNFTLNYIKNNASPSGIVSLPDMSPEAFKLFAAQWREGYEGPQNAGKTAFIRGAEASFKAVGATLKDIELDKVRNMSKDDVLMMLEVPKPLLGLTDEKGFGRGNVETLKYIFAESKLEPMMRRLDRIYEQIAMELTGGQPVEISHESPIPEDKEFILNTFKAGVNIWITPNEARAEMGLEPLPNGDVLDTANKPVQPTKSIKVVRKAALVPVKEPTAAEKTLKLTADQENFRKQMMDVNEVYVTKVKSAIAEFATEQERNVIDRINATSKSFEEWLFNVKDQAEKLAEGVVPIIMELMSAQSQDVAHFITGELLVIDDAVRNVVTNEIKQIAGVYNTDTLAALQNTLAEGQAAGESLNKLKKRVESVYGDAKGYRAERIARTESARNSNLTAAMTYKQNGYTKVKWFINPGACEFCQTFSGQTKEIGTNFSNIGDVVTGAGGGQLRVDYADVAYPPLHPQCTCSVVPVE